MENKGELNKVLKGKLPVEKTAIWYCIGLMVFGFILYLIENYLLSMGIYSGSDLPKGEAFIIRAILILSLVYMCLGTAILVVSLLGLGFRTAAGKTCYAKNTEISEYTLRYGNTRGLVEYRLKNSDGEWISDDYTTYTVKHDLEDDEDIYLSNVEVVKFGLLYDITYNRIHLRKSDKDKLKYLYVECNQEGIKGCKVVLGKN